MNGIFRYIKLTEIFIKAPITLYCR